MLGNKKRARLDGQTSLVTGIVGNSEEDNYEESLFRRKGFRVIGKLDDRPIHGGVVSEVMKVVRTHPKLLFVKSQKSPKSICPKTILTFDDLPQSVVRKFFAWPRFHGWDLIKFESLSPNIRTKLLELWGLVTRLAVDLEKASDDRYHSRLVLLMLLRCPEVRDVVFHVSAEDNDDMMKNSTVFKAFARCPKIKRLSVRLCQFKNPLFRESWPILQQANVILTSVRLVCCPIEVSGVQTLTASLPNLERLGLVCCWFVNDHCAAWIVKTCNRLRYLDVSYCSRVTAMSVCRFPRFVADQGRVPLAENAPVLIVNVACTSVRLTEFSWQLEPYVRLDWVMADGRSCAVYGWETGQPNGHGPKLARIVAPSGCSGGVMRTSDHVPAPDYKALDAARTWDKQQLGNSGNTKAGDRDSGITSDDYIHSNNAGTTSSDNQIHKHGDHNNNNSGHSKDCSDQKPNASCALVNDLGIPSDYRDLDGNDLETCEINGRLRCSDDCPISIVYCNQI